ncbi:MAG: 2Fe-2S iron-sulfur cluster-binding protein [Pseudomonadota bacterium]
MPTIHYILKDGSVRDVDAKPGSTVMENAIRANVRGIDAECGGSCSCATCHVYVDAACLDLLPPPDDMENDLLEGVAAQRLPGSRLSCQVIVTAGLNGLTVRVPETQS